MIALLSVALMSLFCGGFFASTGHFCSVFIKYKNKKGPSFIFSFDILLLASPANLLNWYIHQLSLAVVPHAGSAHLTLLV
jgi:hypothetical protein